MRGIFRSKARSTLDQLRRQLKGCQEVCSARLGRTLVRLGTTETAGTLRPELCYCYGPVGGTLDHTRRCIWTLTTRGLPPHAAVHNSLLEFLLLTGFDSRRYQIF
jgi:hypothetical protein